MTRRPAVSVAVFALSAFALGASARTGAAQGAPQCSAFQGLSQIRNL